MKNLFVIFVVGLLLVILFAVPAFAVRRPRESRLNGGWQVWIEASDFDKCEPPGGIKTGKEVPNLVKNAAPWLGKDIVIAQAVGGTMSYEFESPVASEAYIYCRLMDYRGDGAQSWTVVLNSNDTKDGGDGMVIDTPDVWAWHTNRDNPAGLAGTKLKNGNNTVMIFAREGDAGKEILMDVIMISSKQFVPGPVDENFTKATLLGGKSVQPAERLITIWAVIKSEF